MHPGDEFLKSVNPPERVNLSYEAVELIYSRKWLGWRVYGGGEYLLQKEPADLNPVSAHWGIEYYGIKPLLWNGRPVVGVDLKSFGEHKWNIDTSVKAGIEFGRPDPGQRRLRFMAQWYKGTIRAASFTIIGLSLMDWKCPWDSDGVYMLTHFK